MWKYSVFLPGQIFYLYNLNIKPSIHNCNVQSSLYYFLPILHEERKQGLGLFGLHFSLCMLFTSRNLVSVDTVFKCVHVSFCLNDIQFEMSLLNPE